jgi:hypothetical protein
MIGAAAIGAGTISADMIAAGMIGTATIHADSRSNGDGSAISEGRARAIAVRRRDASSPRKA